MMQRVSSRPRLVSDADKDFVNATVELSDGGLDGSGYADYSSFDDGDGLYFDEEEDVHQDMPSALAPKTGLGLMAAAATIAADTNDGAPSSCSNDKIASAPPPASASNLIYDSEVRFNGNDDKVLTSQSYASSLGDLSGYITCLEDNNNVNSQILMPRPPSLLDLQDSFQKKAIIPADDDDDDADALEDQKPAAIAATTGMMMAATSVKRKRLSHHYLTPKSSYASFTNGPWLYHPLSVSQSQKQVSILQTLPPESLLCVASYLTLHGVRSLATSCHSVRSVLMTSQGATADIWMRHMKQAFPYVFSRINHETEKDVSESTVASKLDAELARLRAGRNGLASQAQYDIDQAQCTRTNISSSEVTLVDDYQLPIPGLDETFAINNEGTNCKVNLPLLTGLIPSRYPQAIDHRTLVDRMRFGHQRAGEIFRSYTIQIDAENSICSSFSGQVVPVVQFTGNVGHGDRCIRSDMPFPPNCIKVQCSCGASCRGRSQSCSSSGSIGGLSSWMRSRSPGRRRKGRSKSSSRRRRGNSNGASRHAPAFRTNSSLSSTSSTAYNAAFHPTTPVVAGHLPPATSPQPSPQSPLFRFISSLSHHCTSPASSANGSRSSSYLDESERRSSSGNDSSGSDDDGLNNYGMMVKHGLLSKCKQGIGKLRQYSGRLSTSDNLRPFVVPTVIEENADGNGRLVIDVTPRLVAYFEVTIVKQGQTDASQDQSGGGLHRRPAHNGPNIAPRINAQHRNNNQQQPPRNNNLWRVPHRAIFPPMHLPLPLEAAIMGVELDVDRAQPFRQRNQALHQQLPANERGQQRHECVAIGLSTQHFSPSDKMPGWDMESYGYHGDDGGIFHGQGDMLRRYGPSFGPGDTVGCGLEYSSRRIFFVKNGVFLGYAFGGNSSTGNARLSKEIVEEGLYPTVGVDTTCPIFVNFGESPFKFDLRRFASAAGSVAEEG